VAWTSSYSPSFAQPLLNTSSDTRKAVLGTDATNLPLDHCASWECGNLEVSYLPTSRALGFARAARIPTSRRLYVPGIAKADLPRALSRVPAGKQLCSSRTNPTMPTSWRSFPLIFNFQDTRMEGRFVYLEWVRLFYRNWRASITQVCTRSMSCRFTRAGG
jgi:hypothetical protein